MFNAYLNERGKFVLLKEQPEFRKLQDALGTKQKELKKQGLGNKPNACREILPSEETKLFETESFSCKDPIGLQREHYGGTFQNTLVSGVGMRAGV